MLSRYNWTETSEGYEFSTSNKLDYLVYFTDFFLQSPVTSEDVGVYSLGITCKQGDSFKVKRKDSLIKNTIIAIIQNFFLKNPEDAVLYICMTDGNARQRSITFGRWFLELGDSQYEKYDCPEKCKKEGFYCSIIVTGRSFRKVEFINSFNYTINNYFGFNG